MANKKKQVKRPKPKSPPQGAGMRDAEIQAMAADYAAIVQPDAAPGPVDTPSALSFAVGMIPSMDDAVDLVKTAARINTAIGTLGGSELVHSTIAEVMDMDPDKRDDVLSWLKDKKKEEESKNFEENFPFNAQCYLLNFIEHFSRFNQGKLYDGTSERITSTTKSTVTRSGGFSCLNDFPDKIVSKLTRKKGLERFFNIRPDQLALLMPRIRLYKVYKDSGEFIEFSFKTHTKISDARGDAVGVRSFEIDYKSSNPDLADNYITANLTLLFENVEAFTKTKTIDGKTFGFYELLGYRQSNTKGIGGSETEDYSIKAVVGWADPGNQASAFFGEKGQELVDAIRQERSTYELYLHNHTLDFRQNGSLVVKIEYGGRLDKVLLGFDADVINPDASIKKKGNVARERKKFLGARAKKLKGWLARLDDVDTDKKRSARTRALREMSKIDPSQVPEAKAEEALIRDRADAAREAGAGGEEAQEIAIGKLEKGIKGELELLEKIQEEKEKVVKSAKEEAELNKMERYRVLLEKIDGNGLWYIDLDEDQLGLYTEKGLFRVFPDKKISVDDTAQAYAAAVHERQKQNSLKAPNPKKWDPSATASGKAGKSPTNSENTKKKLAKGKSDITFEYISPAEGTLRVFYFYMGDLIKAAIDIVNENDIKQPKTLDEIKFIVGPVIINSNGRNLIINLADIPISQDRFLVWFKEKVIKKGLAKYSLRKFLTDVTSELVISALQEGCFEGSKQTGVVKHTPLTVPRAAKGKSRITIGKPRLTLANITDAETLQMETPSGAPQDQENILLMYHDRGRAFSLDGSKVDENFENGIYSLTVGASRGLVKEVKFQKTDIPYQKARYIATKDDGRDLIREPYDAQVRMVGNSIFLPGSTVHINPYLPGGDPAGTSAQRIGLGGFYTVLNVNQSYGLSGYETLLKAKWQSNGVPSENLPPKVAEPKDWQKFAKEEQEVKAQKAADEKKATATKAKKAKEEAAEAKKKVSEKPDAKPEKKTRRKSNSKARKKKKREEKGDPVGQPAGGRSEAPDYRGGDRDGYGQGQDQGGYDQPESDSDAPMESIEPSW